MDNDTDTRVTVEWYKSEVTTYRCALDLEAFRSLAGENAEAALAAMQRGESPLEYLDTDTLTNYEESEHERHYFCDDRTITAATWTVPILCGYPNCHAPHTVIVNDRKLCAEHGAEYAEYRNVAQQ